jgi:uncharacterized membrane protein
VLHFIVDGFGEPARNAARMLRRETTGHSPYVFVSLREIWHAMTGSPHEPLALAALGLVGLLVTPVVGVIVGVASFWREHDRHYTVIAAIVLAMLVVSFVIAGGGG